MGGIHCEISISAYNLLSTVTKMNDFSELDDWDPMAEDFYNPVFNSYRDIKKAITHDLSKLYIKNIPKDYTEEQLLSLMSVGNRKVRHICLFPVKKYESTTAGIVGFYTEAMAEEALKTFSNHYLNFKIEYATRKMTEKVMLKQIELWMPVQKTQKVDPPREKKADLLQSKKIDVLQSAKVNLPQSKKINVPQSKKALKDEEDCKENLPNQPPVEPLSSKSPLCRICGNQIGASTLSDNRGVYCSHRCRRKKLLDYCIDLKLETEKLNTVEEKTNTSDQNVEKTVTSNQSDKEKTKGHESVEKTEEELYSSMVEENRRRRQWIRKWMAERAAEGKEKTRKLLEEIARPVNSCEFKQSRVLLRSN